MKAERQGEGFPKEKAYPFIEQIKVAVDKLNPHEKVDLVARLMVYNDVRKHPEKQEEEEIVPSQKIVHNIEALSELEEENHEPSNPLPTVGLELEFPLSIRPDLDVSLLTSLGVDNSSETNYPEFWEVRTEYSYSAHTQVAFLHELCDLIDIDSATEELKFDLQMPVYKEKRIPTSLHINFGVPTWVELEDGEVYFEDDDAFRSLCALSTIAFVSDDRLLNRKTGEMVNTKFDASESTKAHGRADRGIMNATRRIEIRFPEFRDTTTYRMIIELQYLVAGYFSTKQKNPDMGDISDKDLIAVEYTNFLGEADELLRFYSLSYASISQFPQHTVHAKDTERALVKEARQLITKYAIKIKAILLPQAHASVQSS